MKTIFKIFLIIISIISLYFFLVASSKTNEIEVSSKNITKEEVKSIPNVINKKSNYMFFDWDTTYNSLISSYLDIPNEYIDLVKTKNLINYPSKKLILAVNYNKSDEYSDFLDLNIFLYDSLSNSFTAFIKYPSKFESDPIKLGDVSFIDNLDNLNDSIITFGIDYYFESESNAFAYYEKYLDIYKLEKNVFSELLKKENIYSINTSDDESTCPVHTFYEIDYVRLNKSKVGFYDFKISIKETFTKFKEILDENGYPDCKEISESYRITNWIYKYSKGKYKLSK